MDVAQLQVAVSSTGIKETSRALSGLGTSADNASKKVDKLVSSVEQLISKNIDLTSATAKATQSLSAQGASFKSLMTATDQIAKSMLEVVGASQALTEALSKLNDSSVRSAAGLNQSSKWGNVFTSTLKAMATAAIVYKGVQLGESMVETADKFTTLNARLKIVTGSQNDATVAINKMYDAAQKSRMPLEDMGNLFARMDPAIKKMGGDSNETVQVVTGAVNALKLYGASGKEATGALLQLSHAMASGQLNGREYNAMAQEGRPLLDALLEGYNKLHPAAQKYFSDLKEMVTKHEVTPTDLVQGIKDMSAKWQEAVNSMPITFADSVTLIKNTWFKTIGEMQMDTGFTKELVKAMGVIQEIIPLVARELGNAFVGLMKWIDENKDGLKQIWTQMKGILGDAWNLVGAFGEIGRAILGAGNDINLIGFALFSLRLAVAGIEDGFTLIGAVVMGLGGAIIQYLVTPLIDIPNKILAKIIDGFSWLMDALSKGAGAVGFKDLAATLHNVSMGADNVSTTLKSLGKYSDQAGQALIDKSKEAIAYLSSENNATQRVLNSQEELNKAQKQAGQFQSGKGVPDPKGPSAEELKKAQEELQKYRTEVEKIVVAQQEASQTLREMDSAGMNYEKLTEGQKLVLKYQYELNQAQQDGSTQAHIQHLQDLIDLAQGQAALEAIVQERKKQFEEDKKSLDKEDTVIETLKRESDALQDKINNYHQLAGAVESVHIAETQQAIDALKSKAELSQFEQDMLGKLQQELDLRNKIQNQKVDLGGKQAEAELDKLLDPKKAQKFGNTLKDAFGSAGKALGTLLDSFTKYQERQEQVAKGEAAIAAMRKDGLDTTTKEAEIAQLSSQAQLTGIADVAGATKDFFDQKTAAYKTLDGIERAYRAMEVAEEIKNFAIKSGLVESFTALFVAGKAEESASDTAATGVAIVNATQRGTANAAAGVANQANGDPYTAWVRMAAMAATMAALGFFVGGGRIGGSQAAPTYNTGTGTVLGGSATDTSKSIENSMSDLQNIDKMTMQYSAQMAASLQNIENELGGVANLVFQGGTLNTGNNLGINVGTSKNMGDPIASKLGLGGLATIGWNDVPVFGQFITALQGLWGKTTQEISAAGVAINGTVQQLMNGVGMNQFADVKTTSSSFFGLSKSTSYNTQTAALDPEMQQQFSLIFSSMASEIGQAAQALGQPLDSIQNRLNSFVLNLGKIDLKGLTGKDLQDRLAAVFGAAGDSMAKAALPGFEAFQKVGEGYLETVTRVASGFEQAKVALSGLGVAMVDLNSIVNKQGDVGGELVRQSIEVKEAGTGVGAIMDTLSGSASDLVAAYKQLVDLRNQMSAVNLGTNLTSDLIAAAGGVQSMSSALKAYSDNFFTDSERQAAAVKQLSTQFSALGLQMPSTKEAFRALVDQLEGQGNATLAMQVIGLADAFSQVADASTSVQAVTDAQSALNDAYNSQKQSLTNLKTTFDDFAKSIGDFRNSLMTGNLSPLSPEEKYATISAQYASVSQAALSGDQDAISEYQSVAEQFLQASQQYNASGDQYVQDYQKVLDQSQAILEESQGQSSVAQQQLDALDQQVNGLIQINTSVLTVTQAIENLQAAMTANAVVAPITTGSNPGVNAPTAGTNSVAPIVNSVNALSAQVETLTQATVQNGQAIVSATYDSNAQNAQTIVSATNDAAGRGTYNSRVVVPLA